MMNTRRILDLFKRVSVNPIQPMNPIKPVNQHLGRWTSHDYKQTTLKIKYANEDNCGVSGNSKHTDDMDYIYIMGYETVHN